MDADVTERPENNVAVRPHVAGRQGRPSARGGETVPVVASTVAPSLTRRATRRLIRLVTRTPGRLRLTSIVLVVLGLVTGVATLLTVRQRADLVEQMSSGNSPGVSAQDIYPALADADATAAIGFVATGAQRVTAQTRYQTDFARAAAAVAVAARDAGGDDADVAAIARLNATMTTYAGLVETARALDGQGLPLGFAYLREASELMRGTMLPAAAQVYERANARVAAAQQPATEFPWAVVALGAALCLCLVAAQAYLTRRTHRYVHPALVLATLAAATSVLWTARATSTVGHDVVAAGRDGTAQIQLLAQARIAVFQARADEALALLARGNDSSFEVDFTAATALLSGPDGLLARAHAQARDAGHRAVIARAQDDAEAWLTGHRQWRDLEADGRHAEAVESATGAGPTDGATVFSHLDTAVTAALQDSTLRLDEETGLATGALTGSDVAVPVLTALTVLGILLGFHSRIAEYQ